MVRLVMGNLFSLTISVVCLHKTVELGDNQEKFPAAHKAIKEDGYINNNFLTVPLKEELKKKIEELELVLAQGGFFYKPFIVSGEDSYDISTMSHEEGISFGKGSCSMSSLVLHVISTNIAH